MSLYAVVNINGKTLVDKHRAGDPWQLDPRVPEDEQVGGKYYVGTPLDRGHMVRRVDPVWGKNADHQIDTPPPSETRMAPVAAAVTPRTNAFNCGFLAHRL